NANHGGPFRTSIESDLVLEEAHQAMADLLNAKYADEIVFGANMTSLTFAVSRSIGRLLKRGDTILLTRMDHVGNVGPWLLLAEDICLKQLSFQLKRCVDLESRIHETHENIKFIQQKSWQ
ncbi:MAG: aminotransferase class V-fold PLP-dependent enzyme, partial [SAR324 cluster bacterium]|nr:aminotransferase class V-fold PLP-dependent enzyme [SAR324 cluster bacterium]